MQDRVSVKYAGLRFRAVREPGANGAAGSWQVTQAGAPITTFPASPDDTEGSVREKILGWLRGNEARPARDVGRR